jgi:hypothetical protein
MKVKEISGSSRGGGPPWVETARLSRWKPVKTGWRTPDGGAARVRKACTA